MFASVLLATVFASGIANPPDSWVKHLLTSDDFRVRWGEATTFDATAELEVASGHDHMPWNLSWYRFRPDKDGVEVLAVEYLPIGIRKIKGRWAGDHELSVKSARIKTDEYKSILHNLAIVNSAMLEQVEPPRGYFTWHHSLCQVRLSAHNKILLDMSWCGEEGDTQQLEYPKPKAAVRLVEELVWALDFKDHTLTDEDRTWASAKFERDWKSISKDESAWWVRERAIKMIERTGDVAALARLRVIHKEEQRIQKHQDK